MSLFTLDELEDAARLVAPFVPPTPLYAWPLLARRIGCEVWIKHENHTPIGAFKIRGGIVYLDRLMRAEPGVKGVVTATRGYHMVPSFHRHLANGVATYALELFRAQAELDAVYVPIGMGSGVCGLITTRDLLGLNTEIIGVVAEGAPAIAVSFETGHVMPGNAAVTFADGMACRDPDEQAFGVIKVGVARIVTVSDGEIAAAIRALYVDTHNVAEGAGAAALAALTKELPAMKGKRVALIQTGGNIDTPVLAQVLGGVTPGGMRANKVPPSRL
jgi:threonine dehydratase